MTKCECCDTSKPPQNLRPYGPEGCMICVTCADKPEYRDEVKRRMAAAMTQGGPLTLTPTGPRRSTEAEIKAAAKSIISTQQGYRK